MKMDSKTRQLVIDDVAATIRDVQAKGEISVYVPAVNVHVSFTVLACSTFTLASVIAQQVIARLETGLPRLPGDAIKALVEVTLKRPDETD